MVVIRRCNFMKPYIPQKLPLANIDWFSLISKIGRANRAIANFNGILNAISNQELLLSPILSNEAVLSSKIEGTQVNTVDVLTFEAGVDEDSAEKKNDIHEVINYRKAISYASEEVAVRPVSLYLIKELHRLLLDNARGATKSPGQIREVQNYIGSRSGGIENARFVPPEPILVPEYMDNFVEYLGSDDKDPLVQAAVMHAQFEIIHPFCDGNGRLGRMLVPLFLFQKGIISKPALYISQYLGQNEMLYKDSLRAITENGDWTAWISFFLDAIKWQADRNYTVAGKIMEYYERTKVKIIDITSSQHAILLLDAMIAKPIFKQNSLNLSSNPSSATVYALLKKLVKAEIVSVYDSGAGRSATLYWLKDLLEISDSL